MRRAKVSGRGRGIGAEMAVDRTSVSRLDATLPENLATMVAFAKSWPDQASVPAFNANTRPESTR